MIRSDENKEGIQMSLRSLCVLVIKLVFIFNDVVQFKYLIFRKMGSNKVGRFHARNANKKHWTFFGPQSFMNIIFKLSRILNIEIIFNNQMQKGISAIHIFVLLLIELVSKKQMQRTAVSMPSLFLTVFKIAFY